MSSGPGTVLAEIAERGDPAALMTAVRDTLLAWVGAGPVFLATADPVTGSITGTFTFDIPDDAASAFYLIESCGRDVVSFDTLARAARPVGSLFMATQGRPQDSQRWREVISPLGWGDELRAAVRSHGSTWGYLCIHRENNERPFSTRESARLTAQLPAIGAAMRRATLPSPDSGSRLGTGVIVVDRCGRVAGTTGAAVAWLDQPGTRPTGGLPLVLAGLARQVLDTGQPATTVLTTRAGHTGLVEIAPLHRVGAQQVVVVISAPAPEHHLARLAAASGLTARETEIVSCVLDGISTRAIAERLSISLNTVQAHLTSIFSKTELRSRRELISRLSR